MQEIKWNTEVGQSRSFFRLRLLKDKNIEEMALETCVLKLAYTVLMEKYPSAQKQQGEP